MPSTSALEIAFGLAEPAEAPADVVVAVDDGGAAAVPPPVVTPAACFDPKMADTMLPKMLIAASCLLLGSFHVPRGFVKQITDDRRLYVPAVARVSRAPPIPEQAGVARIAPVFITADFRSARRKFERRCASRRR